MTIKEEIFPEIISPLLRVLLLYVGEEDAPHANLPTIHQAPHHQPASHELNLGIRSAAVVHDGRCQVDTHPKRFALPMSRVLGQFKVVDDDHAVEPDELLEVWHVLQQDLLQTVVMLGHVVHHAPTLADVLLVREEV